MRQWQFSGKIIVQLHKDSLGGLKESKLSFSCHQLVIKINVIGAIKIIIETCLCVLFLSEVDKVHSEYILTIKMRIIYEYIICEVPKYKIDTFVIVKLA